MTFGGHAIAQGDVLATLRELPDNEFHGLLTDPPYGLSFMGKKWDYDVPSVDVWREALRVLRPGAPLVAFGGTRTFHRIACSIEDAGFELRDCLMWMYGKGFPKSHNVSKAIDAAAGATRRVVGKRTLTGNAAITTKEKGGTYGVQVGSVPSKEIDVTAPATELAQTWDGYGTALKPGWEPIILARKPLEGTMVANVTKWGCGPLAIDACRLGDVGGTAKVNCPKGESSGVYGDGINGACDVVELDAGRWPPNVALTHDVDCRWSPNGEACVGDCPIYLLNKQAGNRPGGRPVPAKTKSKPLGGPVLGKGLERQAFGGYNDSGGPSRFFYCAKVSTKEREFGCDALAKKSAGETTDREDGSAGLESPRAGAGRGGGARNHHPTLKPLGLTKWLATMIKPPTEGASLLVPYSGAGSEIIGALQAGWGLVLGIEGEGEYIEIAEARATAWAKEAA